MCVTDLSRPCLFPPHRPFYIAINIFLRNFPCAVLGSSLGEILESVDSEIEKK